MPATISQLQRLLDKLEGPIAREFAQAVARIKSRARINVLTAALERGDIEAAMVAAGFRPGSWSGLTEQIRQAYIEAGTFVIAADVPKRFGMEFDWTNPRAEDWLRNHSSALIRDINQQQREAVQEVLTAGMRAGRNPRNVALDVVGRVSPQTGRRAGGVIGLNGPQAEAAINARVQLDNLDRAYFQRQRRDRRFDSLVRRHIENGTPLKQADVNRIVGRYEDRLLQLRGETVGRTEALASMNEASDEALRQVVDEGLAPREAITRIWDATLDSRTRPDHVEANEQRRGIDEPFNVGGFEMMHPGEGPASQVISCRCVVRREIDFVTAAQFRAA